MIILDFINQAGAKNFRINQGEPFYYDIEVVGENDKPLNLSGYRAKMQVKKTPDTADTVVEVTAIIEDNKIKLELTKDQTAALPVEGKKTWDDFEQYIYDLAIYKDNDFIRLLNGQFLVSPQVTKID